MGSGFGSTGTLVVCVPRMTACLLLSSSGYHLAFLSVYRILCKQPSSPAFSQREKELRQEESIYSEALALWERVG
jgi:hypothetical protein